MSSHKIALFLMLSFANSQLEKTYLLVDVGTSPDHGTNFGFLFSKFVVLVLGTLRLLKSNIMSIGLSFPVIIIRAAVICLPLYPVSLN